MKSYVALMPMVIKFRSSDKATLCEQFCDVFQLTGDIAEKLIKGWWQRLVTLKRFWSHISFMPNDCQVRWYPFCVAIIFHSVTFLHL